MEKKAEVFVAILALFVSIISIFFSCNQFNATSAFNAAQQEQSIKHDKLTVRPLLEFNLEYTTASSWIGVSVINKGIGPALIIDLQKTYHQSRFANWGDFNDFLETKHTIFWKEKNPYWVELKHNQALLPNDEIKLWFTEKENVDLNKADSIINGLHFLLRYTNMYNDTFQTSFP